MSTEFSHARDNALGKIADAETEIELLRIIADYLVLLYYNK